MVVDSPNKNTHNNTLNEENEMMKSNTDDGGGAEEKMTTTTREVEEEEKEDQKDEKEETETTMLSREAKEIDVFVEKIVKVNGVFLREIQKSSSSKEEESAAKASINAWTAAWFVSSERNVNSARNRSWIGNDWSVSVFESDAMSCISVLFVLMYTRASRTPRRK